MINVMALCAGYGGLEQGLELAGLPVRTVVNVEIEAYAAANLVALMESGRLDQAPVWSDLRTFPARSWRGVVSCLCAGFPCQPWSVAGARKGVDDERWIWEDIDRIIREVRPELVFLENVPGLASGTGAESGLGHVLGSLASIGFDAAWSVVRASDAGAPHQRARLFILGVNPDNGRTILRGCLADSRRGGQKRNQRRRLVGRELSQSESGSRNSRTTDSHEARRYLADADRSRLERHGREYELSEAGRERVVSGHGGGLADADDRSVSNERRRSKEREGSRQLGSVLANVDSGGFAIERRSERLSSEDGQHKPRNKPHRRHAFPPGPADREGWIRWIEAGNPEPAICRSSHGSGEGASIGGDRVDQLRLLGNGVCPQQAAHAFRILAERLTQ